MATNVKNFNIGSQINTTVAATITSARAAFKEAAAPDFMIYNNSENLVFVKVGDDTVVADSTNIPIAPGEKRIYSKERSPSGFYSHIAVITAVSTASVIIVEGRGQ